MYNIPGLSMFLIMKTKVSCCVHILCVILVSYWIYLGQNNKKLHDVVAASCLPRGLYSTGKPDLLL